MHAKTREEQITDFAHATWLTGGILLDLVRRAMLAGYSQPEINRCREVWVANEAMMNKWAGPTMHGALGARWDRTASAQVRRRGWL